MALKRPRRRARLLGCAGLCWLAVAAPAVAQADSPNTKPGTHPDTHPDTRQANAELTELRTRIGALQTQLKSARAQESDLAQDVREVEQRIGEINRGVRDVYTQLRDGERQLDALQAQYTEGVAKLEQERHALGRQLRAAYLLGRQEQVKLLLNQEDPAHMGRTLVYYRYLNQARLNRIQQVEATLAQLDALQQQIDAQRVALTETQDRQSAEMEKLAEERQRRESLLGKLHAEIRDRGDQLAQMQKDEKRLEQLIQGLQRALAEVVPKDSPRRPFAKLKRKLPWPVNGKLAAGFGDRREVGDLRWRGAFIAAPANREVRAVAHGRVAFADWLRGFGLLIIIDHGDDYMTLYGHNQALYKAVGDRVAPGDVIAGVGDTGGMDRNGVYFELRHKGEPQNPQTWCVGKPDSVQAAR
ncbi:MAG: peptidoglycan DD-metalloendopeptidase family protein [Gammaproteobacteria bacterium]|nr:peptidoglycan DD-metalloendopeptidase family protein [Gammaproteobacteria bacterium]